MSKQRNSTVSAISAEGLDLIAGRFKALGDTSRLRLMMCLSRGEKSVGDLVRETTLGQANVSRHLRTLTNAGILLRRKEGLSVIYAVADPDIFQICSVMCSGLRKRFEGQAKILGK